MSSSNFLCEICAKSFSSIGNLNKHNRTKHENNFDETLGSCFESFKYKCFEGCSLSFKTCKELKLHLTWEHGFHFSSEYFEFLTFEDFKLWLEELQKTKNVRFYKPRASRRSSNGSIDKFVLMCSRSGNEEDMTLILSTANKLAESIQSKNQQTPEGLNEAFAAYVVSRLNEMSPEESRQRRKNMLKVLEDL